METWDRFVWVREILNKQIKTCHVQMQNIALRSKKMIPSFHHILAVHKSCDVVEVIRISMISTFREASRQSWYIFLTFLTFINCSCEKALIVTEVNPSYSNKFILLPANLYSVTSNANIQGDNSAECLNPSYTLGSSKKFSFF